MLLRIHHKSTFIWTDDRKYILHIIFDTGRPRKDISGPRQTACD
ncbi:hypothetical protein NP493_989g01009 [Ridgeia piscesae]|uniref:Uncharacterized protein n=1 Tax=Ridgeia piscesae TaxID=27915 RepID=A0AAD9NJB7_RIDPI|nr:hypothetical protein NP493_989g01009 [Ridgeia piscesae]